MALAIIPYSANEHWYTALKSASAVQDSTWWRPMYFVMCSPPSLCCAFVSERTPTQRAAQCSLQCTSIIVPLLPYVSTKINSFDSKTVCAYSSLWCILCNAHPQTLPCNGIGKWLPSMEMYLGSKDLKRLSHSTYTQQFTDFISFSSGAFPTQ